MKNWFLRIFISALSVLIGTEFLSGVRIDGLSAAVILALILSFLNTFLKPILILLSIPITLLSLGLFLLVINALIILTADALFDGFAVDSFWWALLFSLMLSVISSFLNALLGTRYDEEE
jgi:putative membrane protein